jgi:Ca2+-binding RTX toxin-like protein
VLRRNTPRLVVITIAVVALLAPLASRAEVTSSVTSGVLEIAGDEADDRIEVTCAGGQVLVNGADPDTGQFACHDVRRIEVAAGRGDDVVDLGAVAPADFDRLVATHLRGGRGDDVIIGTPQRDVVLGGDGIERVVARAGRDRFLSGGEGSVFRGGPGKDFLDLRGPGRWNVDGDRIVRVAGSVRVVRYSSVRIIQWAGGSGPDEFDGRTFGGRLWLDGGAGHDLVRGGRGSDGIDGWLGSDALFGGAGDDRLAGSNGDDRLRGGPGADRISGHTGQDDCAGGPGHDEITECEPRS